MGFFSAKAICYSCGKEVGLNRYRLKQIPDGWICPECLKVCGNINVNKITATEMDEIIKAKAQRHNEVASAGPLQTAEGMYQYCLDNGLGSGFNKSWGLKHFKIIENALNPNEIVILPFIGLHNFISTSKHDSNYAYAITNKRILMGQAQIVGEKFKAIQFDNINDITVNVGMVFGTMTIDTIKETFNIGIDKVRIKTIAEKAQEVLQQVKHKTSGSGFSSSSAADEIRKYKELLDMGAITEEEFSLKKKELLGL